MKTRYSAPKIKALSDVLTFGKHKGKTVRWIIDNEPSYLLWIAENTDYKISQEILDKAEDEEINQTFNDAIHSYLDHNFSSYYGDDD